MTTRLSQQPLSAFTGHTETDDPRLAIRTWLRLLACSSLIERLVRARLRDKFQSTLPRFDVLAQLDAVARDTGPSADPRGITMGDLSRRLMVTNGNLTGLVDRLMREGLVCRTVPVDDRRRQYVRLTPSGQEALAAMTPDHHAWIDGLFGALTGDERQQLYHLLGKLKDAIPSPPGDLPSDTDAD